MRYPNGVQGTKLMFYSQAASLAMIVLGIILALIPGGSTIVQILSLAVTVLYVYGLFLLSKDFNEADLIFKLEIAALVCTALGVIIAKLGVIASLVSLAGSILELVVLYKVLQLLGRVCADAGNSQITEKGKTVWVLKIVSIVITVIGAIVAAISAAAVLAGGAAALGGGSSSMLGGGIVVALLSALVVVAGAIVSIVATILYMLLLKSASETL